MKVAADIMTSEVVTIDSLATLLQATQVMNQHNIKTLIVDRASVDDAYGIITQTDISQAIANNKDPALIYVCEVMTKPCIVVNPNLSVKQIIKLFAQAQIRIAPVIKDKLLGVVSLTDIITKTNYSIPDRIKHFSKKTLPELPSDRWKDGEEYGEGEGADWEGELENWCSG
jgi:CBS domain-containing protein